VRQSSRGVYDQLEKERPIVDRDENAGLPRQRKLLGKIKLWVRNAVPEELALRGRSWALKGSGWDGQPQCFLLLGESSKKQLAVRSY
jgi:hypothetical protein